MFSEFFELPPEILNVLNFLAPFFSSVWQIVKYWFWLPLPFILWRPFSFLWRWGRTDIYLSKLNYILLDIKIPKEVLKPIRAMETVMIALRQTILDEPDWWEKWIDGKIQLSYAFEIVSLGGEPHFYIRIPDSGRDSVEAVVYGQYPEAEISIAEDYAKKVPRDIPNKEWDLWASDYKFLQPNPYPIKTYTEFETEHELLEEKRIDPVAGLLEAMAKIKPGEQLWVQILAEPVTNKELPWITEGQKIRDKIARRKEKPPQKPLLIEAADVLITGKPAGAPAEEKEFLPPEMKLTPGEREIISAVEAKISKPGFKTNIRFIYLGKRDVFFKPNLRLVFGFFASFGTESLNYLAPMGKTLTKIHKSWFLPLNLLFERRLYIRKRKIFKNYLRRVGPSFPLPGGKYNTGTLVLNVEEIASLFHFPGRGPAPAPFIPRVEVKKGEAPPGLPIK